MWFVSLSHSLCSRSVGVSLEAFTPWYTTSLLFVSSISFRSLPSFLLQFLSFLFSFSFLLSVCCRSVGFGGFHTLAPPHPPSLSPSISSFSLSLLLFPLPCGSFPFSLCSRSECLWRLSHLPPPLFLILPPFFSFHSRFFSPLFLLLFSVPCVGWYHYVPLLPSPSVPLPLLLLSLLFPSSLSVRGL